MEAVAETDDGLINKFLEGEEIGDEELVAAAKKAVASGEVVPVLAGSAVANVGTPELLNAIGPLPPSTQRGGRNRVLRRVGDRS